MKIVRTYVIVALGFAWNGGWLAAAELPATDSSVTVKSITMAQARRIALRTSPGKIESAERETEKGKDIYSFDIRRKGQANIDEVQVDAHTGNVISHTTETPTEQAAERKGK